MRQAFYCLHTAACLHSKSMAGRSLNNSLSYLFSLEESHSAPAHPTSSLATHINQRRLCFMTATCARFPKSGSLPFIFSTLLRLHIIARGSAFESPSRRNIWLISNIRVGFKHSLEAPYGYVLSSKCPFQFLKPQNLGDFKHRLEKRTYVLN